MNIKSLILGSAAALVAAGSAQAADLPVAEPVDYVKVCNAYGAGYHFIPGTDTCLKINGYVRAEFRYDEPEHGNVAVGQRLDNTTSIYAKASLNFTAKEETELGTLVGYMRLEGSSTGATSFNKYYLSLGGLYAGVTDSAASIENDKGMFAETLFASSDTGALGYNMALGNGVSAHVALENVTRMGAGYSGQAMPDVAAALRVSQGWGSAALTGVISQIRYATQTVDTDYGYAVGAGVKVNLDMLSEGSTFALQGGYSSGALTYVKGLKSDGGVAVADTDAAGKLNNGYNVFASLNYVWADNFSTALEGGYAAYNDRSVANNDAKYWNVGLTAAYSPVNNFVVKAGVAYEKTDYRSASTSKDVDNWSAKLRLQRDF